MWTCSQLAGPHLDHMQGFGSFSAPYSELVEGSVIHNPGLGNCG